MRFLKQKNLLGGLCLSLVVAALCFLVYHLNRGEVLAEVCFEAEAGLSCFEKRKTRESVEDYVVSQIKLCYSEQGRDSCYEKLAGVLLAEASYEDVVGALGENESQREVFSRCHELAHYLGRNEYKSVGDVAEVLSRSTSACWGGLYHGVIEEYFNEKDFAYWSGDRKAIEQEVTEVCGKEEEYEVPRVYGECLHGIGHAMMLILENNLPIALEMCDSLGSVGERESCYSGVFMQNSSSSTSIDHPSQYVATLENPLYPCSTLGEQYAALCYQYQSSLYADLVNHDWRENIRLCAEVPEPYDGRCFMTIGSNQVGSTQDISKMYSVCKLISDSDNRGECIRGIVSGLGGRYVNEGSRLHEFCGLVEGDRDKSRCYREAGMVVGSWSQNRSDSVRFCERVPEEYRKVCLG